MENKYYEGVDFQRCFVSFCRQRYNSSLTPVGFEGAPWDTRAVVLFAIGSGINLDYCLDLASGKERYPSYALLSEMGMQECLETQSCDYCGNQKTIRWYRFRRLAQNAGKEYNLDAPLSD